MIVWAGGLTAYLAVLAATIWLWMRCECTLRDPYEFDDDATDEVMRILAGEEQHRRTRAFRRKGAALQRNPM